MIAAVAARAAVLFVGSAIVAALYWLFLNTPESNRLTLAVSALLVLLIIGSVAVTVNTTVALAISPTLRDSVRRAVRAIPLFLVAAAPLALAWMAISRLDSWTAAHSGEISAWFIAQFGWSDITWLFTAETWLSRWLRWVAVPLASLSLLAAMLAGGLRAAVRAQWLRAAWHWRVLGAATIVFGVFLLLPWQLTAWRPALPPTWVEPTVAALRLGAATLLALIGSALIVSLATASAAAAAPRPSDLP